MDGRRPKPYTGKEYDVVIGNPPYKARTSMQRTYGELKDFDRFEDYFIARGLDMLKEDGVLVYIVPSSFLSKWWTLAKMEIAKKWVLLDAYRLPEWSFGDTKVGTDIVVFKKESNPSANDNTLSNGSFFNKNPDKVLGEVTERKNKYGRDETFVKWDKNAVDNIKVYEDDVLNMSDDPITSNPLPWFMEGITSAVKESNKQYEIPDKSRLDDIKTPQEAMALGEKFYREWADHKFGPLTILPTNQQAFTESAKVIKNDPSPTFAEEIKETPKEAMPKKPRGMLHKKAQEDATPKETNTVVFGADYENASELLDIKAKQDVFGRVSLPYTYNTDLLNYYDGDTYTNDNYFAGNIYDKLKQLEYDKEDITPAQYEKQKSGLQEILPEAKSADDIVFNPLDEKLMNMETGVERNDHQLTVKDMFAQYLRTNVPGSSKVSSREISGYINGKKMDKEKRNEIIESANTHFNKFVRDYLDSDLKDTIIDTYNKTHNSYVRPKYGSVPIVVEWISPSFKGSKFSMRPAQIEWVNFLTNKWVGLLAYGVWVGKTITGLVATVVNMQRWRAKRPLFIVPKATLPATRLGTMRELFPNTKVVNLGGLTVSDLKRIEKERWIDPSKWIKDGEIAIVTHDGFSNAMTVKPETESELLQGLMDSMWSDWGSARNKESAVEKAEGDLALGIKTRAKTEVFLEDLGVDHITVDEIHNFKNIFAKAKATEDGKVNRYWQIQGAVSARGKKMRLASQYIMNNNKGRNVFLLSATPFNNQAIEVYNIISLMGKQRLRDLGITNINSFYTQFADFKSEIVPGNDNASVVEKMVMKRFNNIGGMQKLITEFIDYKSGEDANVQRPDKAVSTPILSMTPQQRTVQDNIISYIRSAGSGWGKSDGAIIVGMWQARLNALTPYAVSSQFGGGGVPSPEELVASSEKLQYTTEVILSNKKASWDGVFVYWPLGVKFQETYKQYLISKWFKPEEIGVVSGDITDAKKEQIAEDFRTGKVKVLLWGSTTKEGIDLQNNAYTVINLSLWWNPTEMIQVEGRVWRQWNPRSHVQVIYPLLENSSDIWMYQKFEEKSGRINDIFSYQWSVFDLQEVDPNEMKLALFTDPVAKADLEILLEKKILGKKVETIKSDILYYQRMKDRYDTLPGDIQKLEERKEMYEAKINSGDDWYQNTLDTNNKELASVKKEYSALLKKMDERGLTDLGWLIKTLEAEKENLDIEAKVIAESVDSRVDKFQAEKEMQDKNKKGISHYMKEYNDKYSTL